MQRNRKRNKTYLCLRDPKAQKVLKFNTIDKKQILWCPTLENQ